jgi:hypothetical protein
MLLGAPYLFGLAATITFRGAFLIIIQLSVHPIVSVAHLIGLKISLYHQPIFLSLTAYSLTILPLVPTVVAEVSIRRDALAQFRIVFLLTIPHRPKAGRFVACLTTLPSLKTVLYLEIHVLLVEVYSLVTIPITVMSI